MKKILFSTFLSLFVISTFYLPCCFAQDSSYQTRDLPAGAKTLIILSPDVIKHSTEKPFYESLDAVEGVVFSPDGKMLASLGGDNTILLWDIHVRANAINTPK